MAQAQRGPVERRTNSRSDITLPGLAQLAGEGHRAVLRNISKTGAMIEIEGAAAKGSCVSLSSGALSAGGTIVWSYADCVGVRFDQPISDSDLLQQIMRSDALTARRGASTALKIAIKAKRI